MNKHIKKIKEERLEGFEKALKDILSEYEKLGKELEILRNDGKMKTTKFRELLGKIDKPEDLKNLNYDELNKFS